MSLAEKFEAFMKETLNNRFWKPSDFKIARLREAFYAGAEAALGVTGNSIDWEDDTKTYLAIQAEIDHFRRQK